MATWMKSIARLEAELVGNLARLSPTAREKIKATLEDPSVEITWNYWALLMNRKDAKVEPKACGCLMMDGYFKEHPPAYVYLAEGVGGGEWIMPDDDDGWILKLIPFYEMQDDGDAEEFIADTASSYDELVKARRDTDVKVVGGVSVLRRPARKRLAALVEKASG